MRYVTARYTLYQRDAAYRIYLTDCLRILTENTAKSVALQSNGKTEAQYLTLSFKEITARKKNVVPSVEEARERILSKFRGKEKEEQ